ncbi:hypothetical protein HanPI659440_Chr03g0099271 [Helianthus annuus]|nr:hypothetical protein HanPI659440_Chr03g0099271 [Helianthus annuus]
MWRRVLSGVHFLKDLDYLLPLYNEDTGPVTSCSDISGCDRKSETGFVKSYGTITYYRAA